MTQPATAWTSASSSPVSTPVLMVVDDDRTTRALLEKLLTEQSYSIISVASGEEALAQLAAPGGMVEAVILDREMPGLNGLDVVTRLKRDAMLASIPVIMLTGTSDNDRIQEGIDAGVYYYLLKPVEPDLLKSVIASARRESQQKNALIAELNRYGAALQTLRYCQFSLRTLKEAEDTACFLASCFPNPNRVVAGLMELLVNAIEHGNLGITYEEKTQLLAENRWRDEISRRADLPANISKTVDVVFQRRQSDYLVQITDSGPGFDWKRYWHINPSRATASNGRGIARARMMAFDRISYKDPGNSVTVLVSSEPENSKDYAW